MKDYSFGNYICSLRTGCGLSQFQLGNLVGVTDKAVSKWENGDAKPRINTLYRLAEVLGVSINELLSCEQYSPTLVRKGSNKVSRELISDEKLTTYSAVDKAQLEDIWDKVVSSIEKKTNHIVVAVFFSDCTPVELKNSRLTIKSSSAFRQAVINYRYLEVIKSALFDLFSCYFDVVVEV